MSKEPETFQDYLEELSEEIFVGRDEQLTLFRQALTAPRPAFPILAISGQGGVGKTTLLEQYRTVARNHEAITALVNEDHMTVTVILSTFAAQLHEAGYTFKTFDERYRKYRELKEQVEADPNAPSGLLDWTIRSVTRIGVRSLKRVPVAGDALDVLLAPETENELADQTTALARYLASKFTNKDERVLLTDTDAELTRYFLTDLNRYAAAGRLILMFDTFEKTAPVLESWLLNLLEGKFGSFTPNTLFVIAGRHPLGQPWTRYRRAIRQLELHEFSESEARDYLARFEISDEHQVSQLIKLSERLPVLLALLVSAPSDIPQDVSGDAVERFLQGLTPAQREAALIASLPRYFNQDILGVLLGPEASLETFTWLSEAHFVRAGVRGWLYHDVVRSLLLRHFRLRSGQKYSAMHRQLAEYYRAQASALGLIEDMQYTNEKWGKHQLDYLYHHLSVNPPQFIEEPIGLFLRGLMTFLTGAARGARPSNDDEKNFEVLLSQCLNIPSQIAEETQDSILKQWVSRYEQYANTFIEKYELTTEMLSWLTNLDGITVIDRSVAFILYSMLKYSNEQWDFAQAIDRINRAIQLAPDISVYYLIRGQLFREKANYMPAVVDFTKAIELQPENGYTYYWRGRTYYEMKDYPAALADFSQAITLQPGDSSNCQWRGRTYREIKDYPAALAEFSQAIELQPENGNNYGWRGLTYLEMVDYPAALADFSQAIELQPENGYNYYWRGRTYLEMVDYHAALADFSQAIELQPDNGNYYYWRGRTYYEMEEYPTALANFSQAIKLNPGNGVNYHWRGTTYFEMQDYPAALADLTQAIILQPEDGHNYNWRGRTYRELQDYPAALADFSQAIKLRPDDGANYHWRGTTYFEMEDYPAALVDFTQSIILQPENGHNYNWRGRTYQELKDHPAALADLSQAIELLCEDGNAYYLRGLTYREMKEHPAALADFSQTIALQPENAYAYLWRGLTYREMKELPAVLADFSQTIALQPENSYAYHWRGLTYYEMKDYPSALADFSDAIKLQSDDRYSYYWRGRSYWEMRDHPEALADFTQAITLQPEDGGNYYWRGRTYWEIKDHPAALADFSQAIQLQPEDGYNYYWRGRTYREMKEYPSALADFTKAIEIDEMRDRRWYFRALVHHAQEETEVFKSDVATAIQLSQSQYEEKPNDWSNILNLALYFLANSQFDQSELLYNLAATNCPELTKLQDGITDLEDLITLFPVHPHASALRTLLQEALTARQNKNG